MITDLLTPTVLIGIAYSGIRLATPYLYATIGETIGQLSGVLNLGVEGMMLLGAYAGFYATFRSGNPWLGVLAAIAVGLTLGLVNAFISVTLKAEQGISGIGMYLFGLGMSELLFQVSLGTVETVRGFAPIRLPVVGSIPILGDVLFNHNAMVYGAYLLVPLAWFVLNRTTWGLKIRAAGQNPAAAELFRRERRRGALRHGNAGRGSFGDRRRLALDRIAQRVPAESRPPAWGSSPSPWCTSAAGAQREPCWGRSCSAPSMPCRTGCSSWAFRSHPTSPSCYLTC